MGERVAEHLVHVLTDDAGAVVQDVQKSLVLAVQVAHEMLSALGQVENRLQVDDFGEHRSLVGELIGQKGEVLDRLAGLIAVRHAFSLLGGAVCAPLQHR